MRFVAFAAVATALMAGCSDQRVPVAEEPAEAGFTGVDEPVAQEGFQEAEESAESDVGSAAWNIAGSAESVKLFPAALPETLSDAEEVSVMRVLSLDAAEAVEELHRQGFSGQETCGAPSFIPDYAEAEELTYAVITDENAELTARDAANAAWEYYAVVAQTHEQPAPQRLLCLSQVAMLPKLEWKWADLRGLITGEARVSYLLPEEVHVVGLMTGNALAVACLPPWAYGELSRDGAPIAATLLLRWAGDRWRVSFAEDFAAEAGDDFCDRHLSAVRTEFADDATYTGEGWRFGEWRFTADELRKIASESEFATEEVQL